VSDPTLYFPNTCMETSQLLPLRAMAHPARVRVLSLLTGVAMSATDVASELGIEHAVSSYHLRRLLDAGLIEVVEGERAARVGRTPILYTVSQTLDGRLDRSEGEEAAFAAMVADLGRRHRAIRRHRFESDAEVWLKPLVWDRLTALAKEMNAIVVANARRPRTRGTRRGSVTTLVFETGEGPAK
jgi:DNA-binding transcriptional ArsR family regulator